MYICKCGGTTENLLEAIEHLGIHLAEQINKASV